MSEIRFNPAVLNKVAAAIVNDKKISSREAKDIETTALSVVAKSHAPDSDAFEVQQAVKLAVSFLESGDKQSTAAGKVLTKLQAKIEATRLSRNDELKPKFTLEQHRKAARLFGAVIRDHLQNNDPSCPEMWRGGTFSAVRGTKDGLTIVYDYEFLAGTALGEYDECMAFQKWIEKLMTETPSMQKYNGIEFSFYSPDAT